MDRRPHLDSGDLRSGDGRGPETRAQRAAVWCEGLTKVFDAGDTASVALQGVDLALHAGELSLVVGPSGCGKTTLISIIAGLLNPTRGSVAVLGTQLSELNGRRLVEFRAKNIGFVFQQHNLLPALTAAENAAVPLIIAGWHRPPAVAKAKEILELAQQMDFKEHSMYPFIEKFHSLQEAVRKFGRI